MAERLQSRIFSGMDSADAWNEVSIDLVRCAKVNLEKSLNFDEQNKSSVQCTFYSCKRLIFTSDGVVGGVVIRTVERYDLVRIKPTESEGEYRFYL